MRLALEIIQGAIAHLSPEHRREVLVELRDWALEEVGQPDPEETKP